MRTAAWPAWAVATLAASFTAWLFWPGLMSFDSLYQYRQAIGDVPMSAYHPPLMSWAWRVLDGLFGAGGLLLFYLALYWSAVALLATGLARHWLAACALVLLLGLWPPLWIHSATLWNDSGVVAGLLMAVAGLLRAQGPEARRWLAVSAVALFWALAMKRSALFAVLPLVAWWLLTWWRSSGAGRTPTWRRFLYAASAGVLAFMAVSARWVSR